MIKKLSPLPIFLINRYVKWKSTTYLNKSNEFKKLASSGQKPETMVISCCDSRVHVTSIFGADEGEFFIHRNIANLVPPFCSDGEYHGTSAAIEYAIIELKVRHLIIFGHTDCGGIKSAYRQFIENTKQDYEFINKWLKILLPAFNNISKNVPRENIIEILEEESIKNSLNNLFSFPMIRKAVECNNLSLHGLIYDIGSGRLKYLNPLTKKFEIV